MNDKKQSIKITVNRLSVKVKKLRGYSFMAFLVFIALLYGFVLLRVNSLSQTVPSSDSVSSQVKAARLPHIDQSVVKQIESLQDNSVSVQTLFDDARSNPFQ